MDILIIGNGFDLAHGLPTRYKEFLQFCNRIHDFNDKVSTNFINHCKSNIWLKHFITRQNELGDTWIDLEQEILEVIKYLSIRPIREHKVLSVDITDTTLSLYNLQLHKPSYNEKLSKEGFIDSMYPHYINFYIENNNDLINLLYKQIRIFTQLFEEYLKNIVMPKLNDISKYDFKLKAPYILSFNYTDTYERLYKPDNTYAAIKPRYVYVHGKINDYKCQLVLGTKSFKNINYDDSKRNIPYEFNVFKKHNQRHRYNTIEAYQDLIKEITNPHKIIHPTFHIVGHSLNETDHGLLRNILKLKDKSTIYIYFYNPEEEELLINNITAILGEDDVLSRVRFIHLHDDDRSILKRKHSNANKQELSTTTT